MLFSSLIILLFLSISNVRSESPSTAISVPSSDLPSQKTDISIQFYNAQYSIAAWVVTKGTGIIAYNDGYDDPDKGQVWYVDQGTQSFFVNGHVVKGGKSGGSLTNGEKHFVVVTCLKASNGDYQLRLYLDANSDSEIESVMARDRISNTLYVGASKSGASVQGVGNFQGEIMDVEYFTHALSAEEIKNMYLEKLNPDQRNVVEGVQGEKGEKGDVGDEGPMGRPGNDGAKGERGERGVTGSKGDTGEKGEKGERGEPGLTGEVGPRGYPGERGPAGEKGERGERGLPGQAGLQGIPGEKGDKGDRGDVGRPGEKGSRGSTGAQGPPGIAGPAGPRGERGPKGEAGRDGAPGRDGARGVTGARGPVGRDGVRGATGARGPTGPRGKRGFRGKAGERGERGSVGPRGATGSRGLKGDKGDRGITGPRGEKGDVGEIGPRGFRGQRGRRGIAGPRGATGSIGRDGKRGPQGKQGIQGNVGTLWDVDKDTVRAAIEPEAEKLIAGIIGDTSSTVNDDPRSVELKDLESRVSTLEFLVSKLMQPADMSSGLTDQSSASRRRLR